MDGEHLVQDVDAIASLHDHPRDGARLALGERTTDELPACDISLIKTPFRAA